MADLPFDPTKMPDPDFRLPDLIGTVEGWRAWGVLKDPPKFDVTPKLMSVTHSNYYWVPRQLSMADCAGCGNNTPGEDCTCGFYSAKSLDHLMTMSYHHYDAERGGMFHVVGQVALWGKVIEASQGWRAQKAYPVTLYVPYEAWRLAKPLSEAYGVPVRLKNVLRRDDLEPELDL